MTATQQANQLIEKHGFKAYDVASKEFDKLYNEAQTLVYNTENHDKLLLNVKQSDFWFTVSMRIFHLQNQ